MDCYSTESEFIESLDFLSPPVKRINSGRQAVSGAFNTNSNDANVHLLKDFRKKFVRLPKPSGVSPKTKTDKVSESSTSLVLKKTSEGQILGQQYSFISFPSLYKPEKNNSTLLKSEKKPNPSEKPLIKVTVIPKTDSVQAARLLRRRRHTPTKVQSTSSNHENSIQTKNVFLIVSGRRKEKIYEIKTTGSAKLSSDHDSYSKHEDIPITELSNFKHLIQSLDMDKKKKKQKKVEMDTSEAQQTKEWKRFSECNNCVCIQDPQEPAQKSRVRIFGQFGISEDDKYVLRYGATVNDKEVMSDIARLTRDFAPIIAESSYGTTEKPLMQQQDSCLQVDYNYDLDMEKPPVMEAVSTETQGTQVNFNVQVAATQARCAVFPDKKTQCTFCANRSDNNTLKDCQSPMVIISVYPKSGPEDMMKSQSPDVNTRSASSARTNANTKAEKAPNKSDTRRNNKSPIRSRSPSPVKKVSKSKVPDDSNKGQGSEKKSPDRQKALRAIKDKIREKDKLKQETPRKLPLKSTNPTPVSKNLQNVTVSNATQVSKRNQRNTMSQGTQVTDKKYQPVNTIRAQIAKRNKNNTTNNGTQYSNEFNVSLGEDSIDSLQSLAPIKHSIDEATEPKKYPPRSPPTKQLRTQVTNATQETIIQYSTHATQVSRNDPLKNSCATQVSKPHPKIIKPRMGTNQEMFTPKQPQGFKHEQPLRFPKTKAESGTNTEQARAKRAIVESYTKKLAEQMYQNDYIPARFDNSKVTINIDGDRDVYNVLFNQDKISTGLTIKKTIKDMGAPKCITESSLESLLRFPDCVETGVFKSGNNSPSFTDCVERGGFKCGNNSPTRQPPLVLSKNSSEDELPLLKEGSRFTINDIRDSLEISHRREDNLKNTQTGFTAQHPDNVADVSDFSAPIKHLKHFPGDDCSICDPIARDKQIRELLGVSCVKANYSKISQSRCCDNNVGIPNQCIYRQRCKESQVTEINYGLHKLYPCFKSNRPKEKATVSVQCLKNNCQERFQKENSAEENVNTEGQSAIYQQLILNRNVQVFLQVEQFSKQKPIILSRKQYDKVKKTIQKTISMKKSSHTTRNPLLSRIDSSEISIGEVRIKKVKEPESPQEKVKILKSAKNNAKDHTPNIKDEFIRDQSNSISSYLRPDYTQIDKTGGKSSNRDRAKLKKDKRKEEPEIQAIYELSPKTVDKPVFQGVGKADVESNEQFIAKKGMFKPRQGIIQERNVVVNIGNVDCKEHLTAKKDIYNSRPGIFQEQDGAVNKGNVDCTKPKKNTSTSCVCSEIEQNHSELETLVLFNAGQNRDDFEDAKETEHVAKKSMSSVQIRYTSVAFMKQLAYSSTDVGAISDSSLGHLNSFKTLFRGRRKSATPNLGTSAYSLYSEDGNNSENKCAQLLPQDSKPKKPFLRRLMSCLVMRSTGDSELKPPVKPAPPNLPSVNSSIDSYHISTSLGAVEVTSSIYDTSASFYSNHSIHPVNSKIKRGFFSSVRGFLTNRKS